MNTLRTLITTHRSFISIFFFLILNSAIFGMDLPLKACTSIAPEKRLEAAVFSKNYPLVRSILEEEKDNIVIQKMGLRFSVPLLYYYDEYYGRTSPRKINITLYGDKDTLASALKKDGHQLVKADNYVKSQNGEGIEKGRWDIEHTDRIYIPNLIRHACFFGNAKMLATLLSSCEKPADLRTYDISHFTGLFLCSEYDNPECFKILYTTPLLHERFTANPELQKVKCNYLEAFTLYHRDLKIVETLLKSGCFDSNDSIRVYRNDKDVEKSFKDKTLLDIVLREKEKYADNSSDKIYFENIVKLLIAYGAKTAQEVASIQSYNALPSDLWETVIHFLDFTAQQKLRLIWKKGRRMIDSMPIMIQLQPYLNVLRNAVKLKVLGAKVRVLSAATYHRQYCLMEAILKCTKRETIKSYLSCHPFLTSYNPYYFFDDNKNKKRKRIFEQYGYARGDFRDVSSKLDPLLNELIIASFLKDIQKINELIPRLQMYYRDHKNRDHGLIDKVLNDVLKNMVNNNDTKEMLILAEAFKNEDFFKEAVEKFAGLTNSVFYGDSPALKVLLKSYKD